MVNKLTVFEYNTLSPLIFKSVFKVCKKSDDIEACKNNDELKFQFLAAVVKSVKLDLQKLALQKIKFALNSGKMLIEWVFDNEIIPNILIQENLELFKQFKPVLLKVSEDLDCNQISLIYKYIKSSNIGTVVSEYLLGTYLKFHKGVILAVFNHFSLETNEEILFATEFTEKILEYFQFTYQEFNTSYFDSLLSSENVTFNNFGIIILSKLYYRFAINPRVSTEIIEHIKKVEKKINLVQNARLLIELDKLNTNFRSLISEKSAKSAVSYLVSEEADRAYPKRETIQFLLKYLELYIKESKSLEKSMLTDIYYSLQNTENEDIFSEWVSRCIVFCPPDVTDQVFHTLFLENPEYTKWTIYTFKSFLCMFLLLNSFDRCIELKKGEFLMRLQKILRNTKNLIQVALFCNEDIFKESREILVNLNLKLGESLNKVRKSIWDEFFKDLLGLSGDKTKKRILGLIYCFLRPPFETQHGNLMFILYKTNEESDYNEVYVDENSDVRMLKSKIGKKYSKEYWNVTLYCADSKYTRFQDDVKVKALKSNLIIVDFETDNPEILNFTEYIIKSHPIQDYLFQALSEEQDYSELTLKILCLVDFSEHLCRSLYELKNSVDQIVPKTFFSFSFYVKIIEKYMIDQDWIEKFYFNGGIKYTLEIFNSTYSEDFNFNQCFLSICVNVTKKFPEFLSKELVKRIFFACSELAMKALDKDDLVFESLIQAKELSIGSFDDLLQEEIFFQEFWFKVAIYSKNILISVQVMKYFLECSQKSEKCLKLTLRCLIKALETSESEKKYQHEVYDFLKNLLTLSNPEIYYSQFSNKLLELLNSEHKNQVSGFLYCLETPNFIPETEFLIKVVRNILDPNKSFGFSKRIRKNLLSFISVQFSTNQLLDTNKIFSVFLDLDTKIIYNLWNISPDSINIGNFEYVKLLKQSNNFYLNALVQQLYMKIEIRNGIKSLSNPGPLSSTLQNLFKKFEKHPQSIQDPKTTYEEIEKILRESLKVSTDFCSFTKTFIKVLNKENNIYKKKLPMIGKLSFDNSITKGCKHLEKKDSKTFSCLNLSLKYRDIAAGINKIFILENKEEICKECGCLNYLQSKKWIMNCPEVLIVLLERFNQFENSKHLPGSNRVYCEFGTELNLRNYLHEDCTEIPKYELSGIISHNLALNCFLSYCKVSGSWIYFKDDSVKLVKKPEFYKDLFGIVSDVEIKSKINTACVLIFNKAANNTQAVGLVNEDLVGKNFFHQNFLVSSEFLGFTNEIIQKNSPELLKLCYEYFLKFVIRINQPEILLKFTKSIYVELKSNIRNSELFLEVLKSKDFVKMILDCSDSLKSQVIIDLITIALSFSRPSAYMRLLAFLLDELENAKTYKSEAFFELVYNICKLNPALALEEGVNSKLFFLISHYLLLEKIPAFLLAAFSLFQFHSNKQQFENISKSALIHLALSADHNYVTSNEVGKIIGLIEESSGTFTIFDKLLENDGKITCEQKNVLIGALSVIENLENLKKINEVFRKILKKGKKLENESFCWGIEVTFLVIFKNKHFFKYAQEDQKLVKDIEKALNSSKGKNFGKFGVVSPEYIKEVLKLMKNKSSLPSQLLDEQNFKTPMKQPDQSEVLLEINNSIYYKTGQKYKFQNSVTRKFT